MKRSILCFLLSFTIAISFCLFDNNITVAFAVDNELPPVHRNKEEIKEKYKELSSDLRKTVQYDEMPSTTYPYSGGFVKEEYLQDALNAINLVRFIAGLPYNVMLDTSYTQYAQYGAVLNSANNVLSHFPTKPDNMDDDFYNIAYKGTTSSNLGYGFYNIADSIIRGYMDDSDAYNIPMVGHRRWILNPKMGKTGFGYVKNYTATYAHDSSAAQIPDYVVWPARVMPYEMYKLNGKVFSVSLGGVYKSPNLQSVNVKVTSVLKNQTWNIDYTDDNPNGTYFNIDYGGYGSGVCIIFMPPVMFDNNDIITVEITGLEYKDGKSASVNYTVELFSATENNDIDDSGDGNDNDDSNDDDSNNGDGNNGDGNNGDGSDDDNDGNYDYIIYGDVNGDNKTDDLDVIELMQYNAGGWGVEVNRIAADVNCDGAIDDLDVIDLMQFNAGGWGIILG